MTTIRTLEPEVLVPGHGLICRDEQVIRLLDDLDDYARFVDTFAREGHATGRTPLQMAEAARDSRFLSWQENERLVGNLHRTYSELDGNPVDIRLALSEIWQEMVTFHGGPISCFA